MIRTSFPDGQKFNKGKFNTAITNLYANGDAFEFDSETTARFAQLFEVIDSCMPEGFQQVICPDDK